MFWLIFGSFELFVDCHRVIDNELCTFIFHTHQIYILKRKHFILWTPVLDNAYEKNLLWVVHDVGAKAIYNASKMSIWILENFRLCHAWFEGEKNFFKRCVKHLPAEILKCLAFSMFLVC